MSWREQCWTDRVNIKSANTYTLHDLAFDAPILFDKIIRGAIESIGGYGFDPEQAWAYETEIAAITAVQWEVFGGQNARSKANRYDYDILKIKNDLMWAGVQSSDVVEVIFWQDSFDPLVSFARRKKQLTIMNLLDVQYDELRAEDFSYDYIAKISIALQEWADKLINPDVDGFENEQMDSADDEEVSAVIASDLFSMFYAEDDDDMERGESDVE